MITIKIPHSAINTIVTTADEKLYINPNDLIAGHEFYQNDTTISTIDVNRNGFEYSQEIICENEMDTITDELHNVYFRVDLFKQLQTNIPTRL